MARLRVPASPVKVRRATSTYAAFSNRTSNRPSYGTRSGDPIHLDHGGCASETPLPPKLSMRLPIKGTVKSLTSMSRATKRDVQGYIVGQYKAVEKVGHEHIDRTGTKAVFFLGQQGEEEEGETELLDEGMKDDLGAYVNEEEDEDRSWNEMQDFIRRNSTLKTGASAKTNSPSLAQCIASAGVDDANSDLESDSEDDKIDLSQKIEHAISAFAKKIEEYEEDDKEDTTTTLLTNKYIVHHSPLLSPLEAIDIPYPYKHEQKFGPRRHSGGRSLAFLIARAGDLSSSPDKDGHLPSWLPSVPPSPSSTPFPSPNASGLGLSVDDALAMLRERFRIVHYAASGTACCRREWLDAKFETGCSTVHGPSLLRFATSCYQHEEPQLTKNMNTITQPDQHDILFRVRISPSKDTLSTKSSVRTSVFSKCTSLTSMSSYQPDRSQSAHNEYHPHIDISGMDVDRHVRDTKQDRKRIDSLSILTTKDQSGKLRVEEIEQLCVSLQTSAEDTGEISPAVVVNKTYDVPLVHEQTLDFYDAVSIGFNDGLEPEPAAFNIPGNLQRKWTSRMKHFIQKLSEKTKQATRDRVKATKQFSQTAWNFAPTAFSSRHPFQKIDSIF